MCGFLQKKGVKSKHLYLRRYLELWKKSSTYEILVARSVDLEHLLLFFRRVVGTPYLYLAMWIQEIKFRLCLSNSPFSYDFWLVAKCLTGGKFRISSIVDFGCGLPPVSENTVKDALNQQISSPGFRRYLIFFITPNINEDMDFWVGILFFVKIHTYGVPR